MTVNWNQIESKLKSNWKYFEIKLKGKLKSIESKLKSVESKLKSSWNQLKVNWNYDPTNYSEPLTSKFTSLKRTPQTLIRIQHYSDTRLLPWPKGVARFCLTWQSSTSDVPAQPSCKQTNVEALLALHTNRFHEQHVLLLWDLTVRWASSRAVRSNLFSQSHIKYVSCQNPMDLMISDVCECKPTTYTTANSHSICKS